MNGSVTGVTHYKYPSTPHLTWSPEKHRDDSYHPDESTFEGEEVVVLEKMDGENLNIYPNGDWHARSIETPYHPTREWAGRVAGEVGYKLPGGWRVCAENLYGKHSIKYTDLRDYVQVFNVVNDENRVVSWDEVEEWCELLDLLHVPVLWEGKFDRDLISSWTEEDVNEMAGRKAEGYVVRVKRSFPVEQFEYHVGKWVRKGHVNTSEHWLRKWEKEGEKNELAAKANY
jgi:hypothetical protein